MPFFCYIFFGMNRRSSLFIKLPEFLVESGREHVFTVPGREFEMEKNRLGQLFLVLMTLLLVSAMPVSAAVKAKKIKLNKKKLTITVGQTEKLTAKVTPKKANQKVKWKTSNKKIATVSSKGVVKGKKAGKVTITCYSKKYPKIKATCKVTVKKASSSVSSGSSGSSGSGGSSGSSGSETKVTYTDGAELAAAKTLLARTGEPLYQRFKGNKVSSKRDASGQTVWSVGTSANGVVKSIKVYNGYQLLGYTFCNAWGSPSATYGHEVQADNSALKDGSYDFAGDPSQLLVGWGVWNGSTTKAEFEKMINGSISDEVFGLVKDTFSNSFTFSASGGGATIILYGKDTKGKLIGKFAGVMSYNMASNAIYFRVKGINPECAEYYGKNDYAMIPW